MIKTQALALGLGPPRFLEDGGIQHCLQGSNVDGGDTAAALRASLACGGDKPLPQ